MYMHILVYVYATRLATLDTSIGVSQLGFISGGGGGGVTMLYLMYRQLTYFMLS